MGGELASAESVARMASVSIASTPARTNALSSAINTLMACTPHTLRAGRRCPDIAASGTLRSGASTNVGR
jgi:hypothetical protein